MALAEEFGIEFQAWDMDTVDGLAEVAFACAKTPSVVPHIVLQDDKERRLLETNSIEDVGRFLREGIA